MANSREQIFLGLTTLAVGESSGSGSSKRKRFTREKREYLKEVFPQNPNIDPEQAEALAGKLDLTQKQVLVWFQSQRQKNKVEQKFQGELKTMMEEIKADVCGVKKRVEDLEAGHRLKLNL